MNKNKKNNQFEKKGFTLVEILITMGIIIFLSASMLQIIKVSDTQRGFIINAEKIKSGLRLAQTYSLSIPQESTQRHICGFGVHPSGSDMIVYYLYNNDFDNHPDGCDTNNIDYSPGDYLTRVDLRTIGLDSGYSVSGDDIYFRSPYGGVYVEGGGELSGEEVRYITVVRDGDNQSKQVVINGGGKINL